MYKVLGPASSVMGASLVKNKSSGVRQSWLPALALPLAC
jgi:hypothetical protein